VEDSAFGKEHLGTNEEKTANEDGIDEVTSSEGENDEETNNRAETENDSDEPIVKERELEINDEPKSLGPDWSSNKTLDVTVVFAVSLLLIAAFLLPSAACNELLRRIGPVSETIMVQFDQSLETASTWAFEASRAIKSFFSDSSMSIPTFLQEKVCEIVGDCFA
jgi:hypothetical protein